MNSNSKCNKIKSFYPSFAPIINTLSITTSLFAVYSSVRINGSNFFPPINGTTYIKFGNFSNILPVFYSSYSISFIVPLNAPKGDYEVVVVNIYNGNFSPSQNNSYPGNSNYSNPIVYTIT